MVKLLEAADANRTSDRRNKERPERIVGVKRTTKTTRAMTKTFEVISEAIRNPKHPFRKADNRPKKPMKHRYERRKIREYLHLGDWQTEEAV